MTSIESSTSLLEKYSNLHTDMEQARTEAAQCRSEIQTCQGQIQDLLEHRRIMQEATLRARHEQEILEKELDQQVRELEALQNEHDQAMKMRHDHAQHVHSMIQRRHETTRKDYEQSLQNFQTACQDFLKGRILPVLPGGTRMDDKAPSSSSILGTSGHTMDLSVSQQDPSNREKQNHPNNNDIKSNLTVNGTNSNINIMKIDWKFLFAQILSNTNEQLLKEVIQELFPDTEEETHDLSDQDSPVTLTMDHSLAEQGAQKDVHHVEKASDNIDGTSSREDQSQESIVPGLQGTDNQRALESTSPSLLFTHCVQVIDKLQFIQTQMADEAQEKLATVQAQYNQVMQDHDDIRKDHAQWLAKITRQRSQKEQLERQLDRLQNDVKRLHQQIDQVHSQTLELVQEATQTTGPKRQKISLSSDGRDHDSSKTRPSSQVRNPYLQKTKANTSKRPLHESTNESLVASQRGGREIDGPTNVSGQRQVYDSSSRRAIISPLAETSSTRATLRATTSSTIMPKDHSYDRVRESSTRLSHRIGRVRGARDFGVSLSLESAPIMLSRQGDDAKENSYHPKASLISRHDAIEAEMFTKRTHADEMDEVLPAQKPTTTSYSESTTPKGGKRAKTTTGNEPVVVSTAKKGRDSTARSLLRRHRLHDSSSPDSVLYQKRTTTCSEEDEDGDDNDDPVFHYVFRK